VRASPGHHQQSGPTFHGAWLTSLAWVSSQSLRACGSDLNDREDFPIKNARTFTDTSRDFQNFVASRINIFDLEIEAQFGVLSVGANKKGQVKSQGRCGYKVAG